MCIFSRKENNAVFRNRCKRVLREAARKSGLPVEGYGIICVAEGALPKEGTMDFEAGGVDQFGHQTFNGIGQVIGDEIKARTGYDVRTTVLGHIQRGASVYDVSAPAHPVTS